MIILDEPFSGLDPVNAKIFKDLINRRAAQGKVVLFSSHQMPYVEEFCEHVCVLHRGEAVLDGRISDIKKTYPRNKIIINPDVSAESFLLKTLADSEWTKTVTNSAVINDGTLEVTLRDGFACNDLLRVITRVGAGFEGFKVAEPSLEEIFVEKTGDAL